MEVKKSPQADLENKKNIFLEIGLMLCPGYYSIRIRMGKFPGVNPLISSRYLKSRPKSRWYRSP